KTFYQITTDQPGKASWPITNPTYILMFKSQDKPAQAAAALKFFDWAYKGGDDAAKGLDYVPLPDAVKNQIRATWKSNVKDASGKAIYN
ncbi:phosphate ABC transporter substrate-binding protein PstS, partial [Acinetobacter baumannii]